MINVLINGCNGKMGKVLTNCIYKTSDLFMAYGVDKDSNFSFEDITSELPKPDVIIDFSCPEASFTALDYAACNLVPIVIATTGFTEEQEEKILEYSQAIPIFKSSNMSYLIHLLGKVLKEVSPMLSFMDIEILEKHHNQKKDAPSGTALLLADYINSSLKTPYDYTFDRNLSKKARTNHEIGFSSIRGGNVVGEHCVFFLGENESIEFTHTAFSRDVFAEGAIRAARFIVNQKNGLYGMEDLLD